VLRTQVREEVTVRKEELQDLNPPCGQRSGAVWSQSVIAATHKVGTKVLICTGDAMSDDSRVLPNITHW
jgi:hypothetical protein